jgi:UDPglucose--hexose-1-phosphate uridylyltransferase
MTIHFKRYVREAEILEPATGKPAKQVVEYRRDPLTGDLSTVLPGRLSYVKRFFESDEEFLKGYAEKSKTNCPFCPTRLMSNVPRFPPSLFVEGFIKVGETVTFPSLFAHAEYNAVTVLSPSHLLRPSEFKAETLFDALKASSTYVRRVRLHDPAARYVAVVVNYLPPAGSTVIHPHMQTLATSVGFQRVMRMMRLSRRYWRRNRRNYWENLIEEEQGSERYIGRIGGLHVLAPFAPSSLFEVDMVLPGRSSFIELEDEEFASIATGVERVLDFYSEAGVWSFNLALYSGPLDQRREDYALSLKVTARYGFREGYVSDVWGLRHLLDQGEVFESPEELAEKLRPRFRGG